jgi:hypothetical protein
MNHQYVTYNLTLLKSTFKNILKSIFLAYKLIL